MTNRTPLPRRAQYQSVRRQDRWMVPLLARAIETRLQQYAESDDAAGERICLDVGCGEQPLRPQVSAVGLRYVSIDVTQNSAATVDHLGAIDGALPQSLAGQMFDFI